MNWQLPDTMTGAGVIIGKAVVTNVAAVNVVATVVVAVNTGVMAAVVATVDIVFSTVVFGGVINVAEKFGTSNILSISVKALISFIFLLV